MKAIELVHAMCYDPGLASGCTMTYDGNVTLRDYFGAVRHEGTMEYGEYFYFYVPEGERCLEGLCRFIPKPDVAIETEEAGNVLLWKLEG